MKKEEIRAKWSTRTAEAKQTRNVSAFGADFVLHKASYAEIQESRQAGQTSEGGFDSTKHLLGLLVLTARDEDGQSVFGREDLEALLRSDGADMDRLVREALDLNDLTGKAHEEGKEPSPATTAGGAS